MGYFPTVTTGLEIHDSAPRAKFRCSKSKDPRASPEALIKSTMLQNPARIRVAAVRRLASGVTTAAASKPEQVYPPVAAPKATRGSGY
jgi:hypothetical protein